MRIAIVQMHVTPGDVRANVMRAQQMMADALVHDPDVIVLPEMWVSGYAFDAFPAVDARHLDDVRAFASQHRVCVVAGTVPTVRGEKWENTMIVYDRDGSVIDAYAKVHLFRLMQEHEVFVPGDRLVVAPIAGHLAGLCVCYDIRFPEHMRALAQMGARTLFVVAQWPRARRAHWDVLVRARAIENQVYVVACNAVDAHEEGMGGHSCIVSPWGDVLAQAGDHEQVLVYDLDGAVIDEVRARIPVWEDRRKDVYDGVMRAHTERSRADEDDV
ncbi:MAG: carbon-nitrogen family hydrolase [Paenibacillaceae bacterium]|nr:carbon-nitrogen family hydrolase [Paenibacillaceae bacterium]